MSDAYAPEALWLARWLNGTAPENAQKAAAVELERLWEENKKLWEERSELMEALKWIGNHDLSGCDLVVAGHMAHGFIGRARAALAKVEASNES